MRRSSVSSSVMSLYDGGFGGKNANLAAMDEVTPPITHTQLNCIEVLLVSVSSFCW